MIYQVASLSSRGHLNFDIIKCIMLHLSVDLFDMLLPICIQVFTNHHELCVKVQESQVEQVFRLITKSEPPAQAALLQALKSMTVTRVSTG